VGNKWDKFGDARDLEIPPGGNPFWCMVIYYIVKPIKKFIKFIREKGKKREKMKKKRNNSISRGKNVGTATVQVTLEDY
jgi:hypothetical protein